MVTLKGGLPVRRMIGDTVNGVSRLQLSASDHLLLLAVAFASVTYRSAIGKMHNASLRTRSSSVSKKGRATPESPHGLINN